MGSYENDPGAGVVVVRKFNNEYKVLGLRLFGKYDLPKGKIEDDEDAITAAIRETEEEACITDLKFNWGMDSYQTGPVTIFLAETCQEPKIIKNPESGIFEHHGAKWLTWEEAESSLYVYLRGAIPWAKSILMNDQ
jgi:8-oxo-dGTP pyrophosphatase MutT (NUDIX family)